VSGWTANVPAGLEGGYQIDLRGQDAAGHTGPASLNVWQGNVDTVAPRLALTRTLLSNGSFHYTTTGQDFNLTEAGFTSPCGAGVVSGREYFDAPWYRAIFGEEDRLYGLTADCTLPGFVTQNEVGAYDTPGLAQGVAVTGSLAFVADGAAGVQIVDVSTPASPTLVSSVAAITSARGIALAGYPLSALSAVGHGQETGPSNGHGQETGPSNGHGQETGPSNGHGQETGPSNGHGQETGPSNGAVALGGKPLSAPVPVTHVVTLSGSDTESTSRRTTSEESWSRDGAVTDSSLALSYRGTSGADPLLRTFQVEMLRWCLAAARIA
jgi:hypothetical protein